MHCPLVDQDVDIDECPVQTCMFNDEGTCKHTEMTKEQPLVYLETRGLLEEAENAKRRIGMWVYTDQYVQWLTEKPLTMLVESDRDRCLDEDKFKAWSGYRNAAWPKVKYIIKKHTNPSTHKGINNG